MQKGATNAINRERARLIALAVSLVKSNQADLWYRCDRRESKGNDIWSAATFALCARLFPGDRYPKRRPWLRAEGRVEWTAVVTPRENVYTRFATTISRRRGKRPTDVSSPYCARRADSITHVGRTSYRNRNLIEINVIAHVAFYS